MENSINESISNDLLDDNSVDDEVMALDIYDNYYQRILTDLDSLQNTATTISNSQIANNNYMIQIIDEVGIFIFVLVLIFCYLFVRDIFKL